MSCLEIKKQLDYLTNTFVFSDFRDEHKCTVTIIVKLLRYAYDKETFYDIKFKYKGNPEHISNVFYVDGDLFYGDIIKQNHMTCWLINYLLMDTDKMTTAICGYVTPLCYKLSLIKIIQTLG